MSESIELPQLSIINYQLSIKLKAFSNSEEAGDLSVRLRSQQEFIDNNQKI